MSEASPMITVPRRYRYLVQEIDRWGNRRLYFRVDKGPRVRIREKPDTEEFDKRYHELMRQHAGGELKPAPRDATKTGTFRSLCEQYMGSGEFKDLDPRTQRVRRQIIDHMCAEPIAPGDKLTFRDCPLTSFTAKAVGILRDRKRDAPESANARVKIIRAMYRWALDPTNEVQGVNANPARDVPFLKPRRKGGFPPWSLEEVEQFEKHHPVGTKARLALALILGTGARRSDAILLGKQHIRNGWLKFTAFKGRNKSPVTVEFEVLPVLLAAIDASPTGDLTFLVTEFGMPYTHGGFGNWFRRQCRLAGLPKYRSAHGLRKVAAQWAAENKATAPQLMAIFGWRTIKQAELYIREAERKRLAADAPHLLVRPNDEQKSLTLDVQTPPVRGNQVKD